MSEKITSIPKTQWGVHETHCCANHGCKYGDADCPVVLELTGGLVDCEDNSPEDPCSGKPEKSIVVDGKYYTAADIEALQIINDAYRTLLQKELIDGDNPTYKEFNEAYTKIILDLAIEITPESPYKEGEPYQQEVLRRLIAQGFRIIKIK